MNVIGQIYMTSLITIVSLYVQYEHIDCTENEERYCQWSRIHTIILPSRSLSFKRVHDYGSVQPLIAQKRFFLFKVRCNPVSPCIHTQARHVGDSLLSLFSIFHVSVKFSMYSFLVICSWNSRPLSYSKCRFRFP